MASKASVHDCVASCTWEEHCGDKSMHQRTAVQTAVSTEQTVMGQARVLVHQEPALGN